MFSPYLRFIVRFDGADRVKWRRLRVEIKRLAIFPLMRPDNFSIYVTLGLYQVRTVQKCRSTGSCHLQSLFRTPAKRALREFARHAENALAVADLRLRRGALRLLQIGDQLLGFRWHGNFSPDNFLRSNFFTIEVLIGVTIGPQCRALQRYAAEHPLRT